MQPFGRMRNPGGFWPGNAAKRKITVAGEDRVAKGTVALIDRLAARGMSGHTGHIGAGLSASPAYKFSGYFNYPVLALTRTVGASTNLRGDPNVALPATSGALVTVAPGSSVAASLAAIPPGYR